MNVSWFPCIHDADVTNRSVDWGSPPKPFGPSASGQVVVVEPYEGRWTIPAACEGEHFSNELEDHESTREERDGSSFSVVLAQEVMSISRQPLCSSKVIATMAATYQAFLTERNEHDCSTSRAKFRVIWWQKARANDVLFW
jgi:hypothetical protein